MKNALTFACALAVLSGCAAERYTAIQEYQDRVYRERAEAAPQQRADLASIEAGAVPGDYREQIDRWMIDNLKDPESRRVEFAGTPFGSLACGTVNAKNTYGGYTGKRPFIATFEGNRPSVIIHSDEDVRAAKALGGIGEVAHVRYELLRRCGFAT